MSREDWMQTYAGRQYYPLAGEPFELDVIDIAHALSMICRFGGHTRRFYSVAEHSILVSRTCAPEDALAGLLHDAAEAYIGDMIRPMKRTPDMAGYRAAEDRILASIMAMHGLPAELPESVKRADNAVLAAERDHPAVMAGPVVPWAHLPPPASVIISCWGPEIAERRFHERYEELTQKTSAPDA